jgi:nucleoside-diphosphate-sugar epimerase
MKVAITGGTGFIGRHLARDLVSRGHEVILIARGQYQRNTQPVEGASLLSLDRDEWGRLKTNVLSPTCGGHALGSNCL